MPSPPIRRPPYYFQFDSKPTIQNISATTMQYGQRFTISYTMFDASLNADRAVLVAPSATTHSTNMHQRVVGLKVVDNPANDNNPKVMVVEGPPNRNIAPPGMYMLFLLNGDVYSKAVWVTLPQVR